MWGRLLRSRLGMRRRGGSSRWMGYGRKRGYKMRAVVNLEKRPYAVELQDRKVPEIGPTDVLLKVKGVGVCGSDLHQWHASHAWNVNYPVVLGHEFGGEIASVGSEVKSFKEGDRVVSETAAYICGECVYCRTGNYQLGH